MLLVLLVLYITFIFSPLWMLFLYDVQWVPCKHLNKPYPLIVQIRYTPKDTILIAVYKNIMVYIRCQNAVANTVWITFLFC
jgi:hypothetical protein